MQDGQDNNTAPHHFEFIREITQACWGLGVPPGHLRLRSHGASVGVVVTPSQQVNLVVHTALIINAPSW